MLIQLGIDFAVCLSYSARLINKFLILEKSTFLVAISFYNLIKHRKKVLYD
jgi:hypothetical protein